MKGQGFKGPIARFISGSALQQSSSSSQFCKVKQHWVTRCAAKWTWYNQWNFINFMRFHATVNCQSTNFVKLWSSGLPCLLHRFLKCVDHCVAKCYTSEKKPEKHKKNVPCSTARATCSASSCGAVANWRSGKGGSYNDMCYGVLISVNVWSSTHRFRSFRI